MELSTNQELLRAALEYAKHGISVFPCVPKGKKPLTRHGYKDASLLPEQIEKWWGKWPDANIGIPTGQGALYVLDVDIGAEKDGETSLAELEAEHGKLPATVRARSGGGGYHLYFFPTDSPIRNSNGENGWVGKRDLDFQGDGGHIIAPPSRHASGEVYRWEAGRGLGDIEPAPLPDWMVRLAAGSLGKSQSHVSLATNRRNSLEPLLAHFGVEINKTPSGHIQCPFPDRDLAHNNGDETPSCRVVGDRWICVCSGSKWRNPSQFAYRMLGGREGYDDAEIWDCVEQLTAQLNLSSGEISERSGPYATDGGGFVHLKTTKEGPVVTRLTNFLARIAEDITVDDGAERTRIFAIEGNLANGQPLPRLEVPADQFEFMNWLIPGWGSKAVRSAGPIIKDRVREAIQQFSEGARHRNLFSHLGWRSFHGKWCYLHAGGVIAEDVPDDGVGVLLDKELMDFRLPDEPPGTDRLQEDIRESLNLLDVAPARMTFPLLAAVYRAPLGEMLPVDFSLVLVGETGCQKTELTALAQAHFGSAFRGDHLPANWSSTANALEKQAFLCKDVLFVVDDFSPGGTQYEIQQMHRKADRLFRSQGNRAGRRRMRADISLRPEYYPRGLIISSGEIVPAGESLRARLLIIPVKHGDVNLDRLTQAQRAAAKGTFASVMVAYVKWLAGQFDPLRGKMPEVHGRFLQEEREGDLGHDRTPDNIASLRLGWVYFLFFALEQRAISKAEFQDLWDKGAGALTELAQNQEEFLVGEDPVNRFLDLLVAAFEAGRAHLIDRVNGDSPPWREHWGWRNSGDSENPSWHAMGERIGWLDPNTEVVLLQPDIAYAAAQKLARDQGGVLPAPQTDLWRRMAERGLLAESDPGRHTKKRLLGKERVRVVHIPVSAFPSPPGLFD